MVDSQDFLGEIKREQLLIWPVQIQNMHYIKDFILLNNVIIEKPVFLLCIHSQPSVCPLAKKPEP